MEGRCWLVMVWWWREDVDWFTHGVMMEGRCWLVMVWWWREDVDWFKHGVMIEGRCWLVVVWWWREDVDWFKHDVMMEGRCWLVHTRCDDGGKMLIGSSTVWWWREDADWSWFDGGGKMLIGSSTVWWWREDADWSWFDDGGKMLIGHGLMVEGRCWLVQARCDDGAKMLIGSCVVWQWRLMEQDRGLIQGRLDGNVSWRIWRVWSCLKRMHTRNKLTILTAIYRWSWVIWYQILNHSGFWYSKKWWRWQAGVRTFC